MTYTAEARLGMTTYRMAPDGTWHYEWFGGIARAPSDGACNHRWHHIEARREATRARIMARRIKAARATARALRFLAS